ncbi:putative queuine tRNA-ribosyltransferase accessory subunit 2 [Elsinoe australis]|uniref:Putative queuine tRNA-ribosyltransferase accessory subunit 2 n=1 Tax=Elsinoe australis TaxID=40998 RepID=A0A4U7B9T5_9PEZI|nr:putative queuine tRNA-ribosyltransferase accessory subunit 2 [Elsinoe australis]
MFTVGPVSKTCAARIGRLALPRRSPISTPNYIVITSRGAVPHVAQDVFSDSTGIPGVYVALEDFIERAPQVVPPILQYKPPGSVSPLRSFIALPDDSPLVLGPRRVPAIACPGSNTSNDIQIFTSVGFTRLAVSYYSDAAAHLKPDIMVGLADISFGVDKFSQKRKETMADRTSRWMLEQVQSIKSAGAPRYDEPAVFAPVLPLEAEAQRWYFEELVDSMLDSIGGLAVYDADSLRGLPEPLQNLPRLSFTKPDTPQKLLGEISQGVDVFTIPFIGSATDAGIALDFSFPVQSHHSNGSTNGHVSKSLGVDMWSDSHTTSLTPLSDGCAKEMLGWVLLQIHNHHTMDKFFEGVRSSIRDGSFEADKAAFERLYEPTLPAKTGQGPRVRGYQYKSDGPGEVKRNPTAFRSLDGQGEKSLETPHANPIIDVKDIEGAGLAKKT